eukprot:tig00000385_g24768.t1
MSRGSRGSGGRPPPLAASCSRYSLRFTAGRAATGSALEPAGANSGSSWGGPGGPLTVRRLKLPAPAPSRAGPAMHAGVDLEEHYKLVNALRRVETTRWASGVGLVASIVVLFSSAPLLYRASQLALVVASMGGLFALTLFPTRFNRHFEDATCLALLVFSFSQRGLYEALVGHYPHLLLTTILVLWLACSYLGLRFHVSVIISFLLVLEYIVPGAYVEAGGGRGGLSWLSLASCGISGFLACGASYLRDRNERKLFWEELYLVRGAAGFEQLLQEAGAQTDAEAGAGPGAGGGEGAGADAAPADQANPVPRSEASSTTLSPPLSMTSPPASVLVVHALQPGTGGIGGLASPPAAPSPITVTPLGPRAESPAPPPVLRLPPIPGSPSASEDELAYPEHAHAHVRRTSVRLLSSARSARTPLEATQAAAAALAIAELANEGASAPPAVGPVGGAWSETTGADGSSVRSGGAASARRVLWLDRDAPRASLDVAGAPDGSAAAAPAGSQRKSRVYPLPPLLISGEGGSGASGRGSPTPAAKPPSTGGFGGLADAVIGPMHLPYPPTDPKAPSQRAPEPPAGPGDSAGDGNGDGPTAAERRRKPPWLRRAARWVLRGSPFDPPELEARFQAFYADLAWARARFLCVPLAVVYIASNVIGNLYAGLSDPYSSRPPLWDWIFEVGLVSAILLLGSVVLYVRPRVLVPHWSKIIALVFLIAQFARLTSLRAVILGFSGPVTDSSGPDWTEQFWNELSALANLSFVASTFNLPSRVALGSSCLYLLYAAYVILAAGGLRLAQHLINFILIPVVIAAVACARGEVNLRRRFCIEQNIISRN